MLKGTTKIELTNVKTGETEVIEKENMVTNAVRDILQLNPYGVQFWCGLFYVLEDGKTNTTAKTFRDNFLPLCPNLFGGILLYENQLPEDADQYFAPMSNPMVGYSSNNVNTTDDVKRGSMNQTESGPLEDGSGYKFVFDFATSQANGQISALGLTSKWGGVGGYASTQDTNGSHIIRIGNTYTDRGTNPDTDHNFILQASTVAIDPQKNTAIYAMVSGSKTIEIGRYPLALSTIRARTEFDGVGVPNSAHESTIIETTDFAATLTSDVFYGTLIDGGDGYIWGFQHENNTAGNSSGNAKVLWIKISKDDFSFTEGSFVVDAKLYPFGCYYLKRKGSQNLNYAIIKDGILYAIEYNSDNYMAGVYSIPLENPTNANLLKLEGATRAGITPLRAIDSRYYYYSTAVNDINGVVQYRNCHINGGKLIYSNNRDINDTSGATALCGAPKPGMNYGPFKVIPSVHQFYSNQYVYDVWCYIMLTYLATINNLPSPVQKTADKTMKITYILREEME